jgi:hypothetical protein
LIVWRARSFFNHNRLKHEAAALFRNCLPAGQFGGFAALSTIYQTLDRFDMFQLDAAQVAPF